MRARAEAPHSLHIADRIRDASLNERDFGVVAEIETIVKQNIQNGDIGASSSREDMARGGPCATLNVPPVTFR